MKNLFVLILLCTIFASCADFVREVVIDNPTEGTLSVVFNET